MLLMLPNKFALEFRPSWAVVLPLPLTCTELHVCTRTMFAADFGLMDTAGTTETFVAPTLVVLAVKTYFVCTMSPGFLIPGPNRAMKVGLAVHALPVSVTSTYPTMRKAFAVIALAEQYGVCADVPPDVPAPLVGMLFASSRPAMLTLTPPLFALKAHSSTPVEAVLSAKSTHRRHVTALVHPMLLPFVIVNDSADWIERTIGSPFATEGSRNMASTGLEALGAALLIAATVMVRLFELTAALRRKFSGVSKPIADPKSCCGPTDDHTPSPRQNEVAFALVPLLRFVTGKLPVTPAPLRLSAPHVGSDETPLPWSGTLFAHGPMLLNPIMPGPRPTGTE